MRGRWTERMLPSCVLVLSAAACVATADVQATRDPRYAKRMRSLYVAIGQGGIDEDFAIELDGALKRELAKYGTRVTSRVLTGLELDPQIVEREAMATRPDGILLVQPVRGASYDGTITNLTYDLNLLDMPSGARVWRARVDNKRASGVFGTVKGVMEETALQIARQLAADRLLPGGG